MKQRIILALAVLMLATPAFAAVTITATDEGGGVVRIDYSTDANVSAFAFDITVTAGTITACDPCHVGESNSVAQGYGIFPGTIAIDGNGVVTDDGTPVAPNSAPSALGGLGTAGITIEMGALYEDGNQPALSGTLCRVTVDSDCNLIVAGNAARGDVVLTDANSASTNLPVEIPVVVAVDCYTGPDVTEWNAVGKPDSWCYPRQCHGDADGIENVVGHGAFWVADPDITILLAGYKTAYSGDPVTDPWIAADFNHTDDVVGHGTFRVADPDITILLAYYKATTVPADCLD